MRDKTTIVTSMARKNGLQFDDDWYMVITPLIDYASHTID
jgi:hypothetical protein